MATQAPAEGAHLDDGKSLPRARRVRPRPLLGDGALVHLHRLLRRRLQQLHRLRPERERTHTQRLRLLRTLRLPLALQVFSRKLLSTHYNFINLQFYTSAAALVVQLPIMLCRPAFIYGQRSEGTTSEMSRELFVYLIINGAFFHLQVATATRERCQCVVWSSVCHALCEVVVGTPQPTPALTTPTPVDCRAHTPARTTTRGPMPRRA